jgi:hypothetical protein
MPSAENRFHEELRLKPIRSLGLTIAGTQLEPIVAEFEAELAATGLRRVRPRFYLSTEWGVPFGTVAVAIPFYLARPDLTDLHAQRVGHVEGVGRSDILRYLRHEMGHVANYAYRLYDREDWVKQFGPITRPYEEEYRPTPFSRRYVRHLPGFYAQKHPDEDWAETFAVWMTPGPDWRAEYADWPTALGKLAYCARVVKELADREPVVQAADLDEEIGGINYSLEQYYGALGADGREPMPPLDGAIRAMFEEFDRPGPETNRPRRVPAGEFVRGLERQLTANVYRWTGHFPERTRRLVRHIAERADQLKQVVPEDRRAEAGVALTTLVAALAMNYVHCGGYMPASEAAEEG